MTHHQERDAALIALARSIAAGMTGPGTVVTVTADSEQANRVDEVLCLDDHWRRLPVVTIWHRDFNRLNCTMDTEAGPHVVIVDPYAWAEVSCPVTGRAVERMMALGFGPRSGNPIAWLLDQLEQARAVTR